MSMGIKVAELNTLSDGKGITGIRVFNEMEDTNESTNLRKLAEVWMSKNRCCQGHCNRSAVSVTRITVDIGHPNQEEEVNPTSFPEPKAAAKCPFSPQLHGQKPSKSSSESESGVHFCRAAVKTRQNLKEWSFTLNQKWTNQPDIREWKILTCTEIICEHCWPRHRMQRHRFMCAITEVVEVGRGTRSWRAAIGRLKAV